VSGIMGVAPVTCPSSSGAAVWCAVVLTVSSAMAMRLIRLQRCQEFQQVTCPWSSPALRTGLRKGELLGLRWENTDLNSGTATIRHSLQRTRTGGLTQLPTKTRASERRIALPTECIHSLKEHNKRQEKERQEAGASWTDTGLVFTTLTGRPLDASHLSRSFRRFLDHAGLRHIRFHDLRHTTATLLLEQGVDLAIIKELSSATPTSASPPTSTPT
jgi:integrase